MERCRRLTLQLSGSHTLIPYPDVSEIIRQTSETYRAFPLQSLASMISETSELDLRFGMAIEPKARPIELQRPQKSLMKLDHESAEHLRSLIERALAGCRLTRTAHDYLPILWVVDESGEVWLGWEEVLVEVDEVQYPCGSYRPAELPRLGHPALIRGKRGRIGGEIIWDDGGETPGWYLTNASGRFGKSRTADQLANAAEVFKGFGIVLETDFY